MLSFASFKVIFQEERGRERERGGRGHFCNVTGIFVTVQGTLVTFKDTFVTMEGYKYYLIPELLKPLKKFLKQPLQLLLKKWNF